MTDHVKPTLREVNPDHIVLHAGTNDLRTEKMASQIAKATIYRFSDILKKVMKTL